ncbi:hypothetical protein SAMN05660380_02289, partial [Xylella fastidiosa]
DLQQFLNAGGHQFPQLVGGFGIRLVGGVLVGFAAFPNLVRFVILRRHLQGQFPGAVDVVADAVAVEGDVFLFFVR